MFFKDWKSRIYYNNKDDDDDDGHYNKLSTGTAASQWVHVFVKHKRCVRTATTGETRAPLLSKSPAGHFCELSEIVPQLNPGSSSTGSPPLEWKASRFTHLSVELGGFSRGSMATDWLQGPGRPLCARTGLFQGNPLDFSRCKLY